MIQVKNLTKHYGSIVGLEDVSFNVNRGEILGFLGPNGAGKTTAMNIITGYLPPTSGTVLVEGKDVMEDAKAVKKLIGYLPEQPPLYMDMTVKEYLNFICDLKDVEQKKRKAQLDDIMYLVKIGDKRKRLIKNLSKGYKQRVGLAQALVGDPPVLILDEPTVGLDPKQIIEIRKLITALGKDHTIILSTHILAEVSAVCSDVLIINNGKMAIKGKVSEFSGVMASSSKFMVQVIGPKEEVLKRTKKIEGVKSIDFLRVDGQANIYMLETKKEIRIEFFKQMAEANLPIIEIRPIGKTIEDIFIDVVSKDTTIKEEDK